MRSRQQIPIELKVDEIPLLPTDVKIAFYKFIAFFSVIKTYFNYSEGLKILLNTFNSLSKCGSILKLLPRDTPLLPRVILTLQMLHHTFTTALSQTPPQ